MAQRIGLFGGTFNPPHLGHLVAAVNVRHALQLDLVILMVANDPWQKHGSQEMASAQVRLDMVRAAVDGIDGLTAGSTEIARGGPSYTADTLAELADLYIGAQFFTIVGHDAASNFGSWQRCQEIASRSTLVIVDRPGSQFVPPSEFAWNRVEVPQLEVSSSDLRRRFADGRPLDFLIPDAVLEVIEQRGLYRNSQP